MNEAHMPPKNNERSGREFTSNEVLMMVKIDGDLKSWSELFMALPFWLVWLGLSPGFTP